MCRWSWGCRRAGPRSRRSCPTCGVEQAPPPRRGPQPPGGHRRSPPRHPASQHHSTAESPRKYTLFFTKCQRYGCTSCAAAYHPPQPGSQDTSPRQRGRRAEFGSFASAAAGGDSYNNALAESVIALSRSELFRGRDQSPSQSVDDIGPATSGRAHSHNPGRLLSHLGDIRAPGGPPTPRSRTGLEINRPHSTKLGVVHHHPRSRGGWSAAGARRPFHLHWNRLFGGREHFDEPRDRVGIRYSLRQSGHTFHSETRLEEDRWDTSLRWSGSPRRVREIE